MAHPTPSSGVNPAPQYKEKSNAIASLMSRHTSGPSLRFLSSLPSKTSFTALKKTPAQLAAEREDQELDRLAQYDDNMGVGLFVPSEAKRKEQEAKRAREAEDRKLKARLGLGRGKRKGAEWEGVSGVAQAQEQSDDEEELGRSGVGRAKKRKRTSAPVVVEGDISLEVDSQQKGVDVDRAEAGLPHGDGPKADDGSEEGEAAGAAHDARLDTTEINGDSNTEMKAKRKRKKKKKTKSTSQGMEKSTD